MRGAVAHLAVIATVFLTGCGGGEEGGAGAPTAGAAASTGLTVSATEFAFDPAELAAEPGILSLELVNEGQAPHALAVRGNGIDESSATVDGGVSTTLEVELAEGTYEIYCPVGNHREQGMVGTLTVGSGAGQPPGGSETDDGGSRY